MLRELEELHKRIADDDEGVPAVIRMHSNESPLSPPVEVVSSITDYAQRYVCGPAGPGLQSRSWIRGVVCPLMCFQVLDSRFGLHIQLQVFAYLS